MKDINILPTSDETAFLDMLNNPNKPFFNVSQKNTSLIRIPKHIVISYISDITGCGHIRNIFPMNYMNAVFGRSGGFNLLLSPPGAFILQPEILQRTRAIFFQRVMDPRQIPLIQHYKNLQSKYKFKMIYDIDDFIWSGNNVDENIPDYNFGKKTITLDVQNACVTIMKLMDIVCVSTDFLGECIASKGIPKNKIQVIHNTISQFFWGNNKKEPIKLKLIRPKVIWSASPTHWSDEKKMAGDMDNSWREWVIKSVNENKIDFYQMGGNCPWFFESIKNNITVIPWLNSYQYHLAIKNINPDFGIAPLVPNYFNYSKSCIKYQEYCAVGAVGIGTYFTNNKPSPYDVCKVKVPDNITVDEIEQLFDRITEPDEYNKILYEQYNQLINEDWYTESSGYINKFLKIL